MGRLLLFEALRHRASPSSRSSAIPRCPICGPDAPEIADEDLGKFPDYEAFCSGAPVPVA